MSDDLYQEIILEEYRHPQHVGQLPAPTQQVQVENSSCGDRIHVDIVTDKNGQIIDLAWSGQGCAISQASASLLSTYVLENKLTLSEVAKLQQDEVLPLLGLTQIASGRQKCLMMMVRAFRELQKAAV